MPMDHTSNGKSVDRPTYWGNFLAALSPFLDDTLNPTHLVKEPDFKFSPSFEVSQLNDHDITPVYILVGYFQSYRYFDEHLAIIRKMLRFDAIKAQVLAKSQPIADVSMHFRIGDYVHYPTMHPIQPIEYYMRALNEMFARHMFETVLFFCEDCDYLTVMEVYIGPLVKANPYLTFIHANPNLTDWEQMVAMSLCPNNIIANSAFSWWAAYLNTNPDKIVIAPKQWFGSQFANTHPTDDLLPKSWIQIDCADVRSDDIV